MRFFFRRLLPHGQYGAGLRLLPCGQYAYAVRLLRLRRNTTHLCAYCPTGNTAPAQAIALRAIRLRCSSIAAAPQYDSPMRLLPHGQYGAGSGYCPAGNTPTLFVYCGYAAIRLTHAPIAPRAIRRRHEQKKAQPNGCAQKCACKAIIRISLISISYRWASNRKRPFP